MPFPIHVAFVRNAPTVDVPAGAAGAAGAAVAAAGAATHVAGPAPHEAVIADTPAASQSSSDDDPLPTTEEQLKERFIAYLKKQLRLQGGDPDGDYVPDSERTSAATTRRRLLAVLGLALDPTAQLSFLSLGKLEQAGVAPTDFLRLVYNGYEADIRAALAPWFQTERAARQSGGPQLQLSRNQRPAADATAQQLVPTWYGRCVLTGPSTPIHGAHILPVRGKNADLNDTWRRLRCMWPLPDEQHLLAAGHEKTNIFPLAPSVHAMWDRFLFAVRPLPHPTDPQHRLDVQMIWLKNLDRPGSLVTSPWSFARDGGCVDFSRGSPGNLFPAVQHGDVYELTTSDPAAYPLPSVRFLQVQYAVHKLMAGFRGGGALAIIFGGEPPAEEGPVAYDVRVPDDWWCLLEDAVEARVLDREAASRWANAFMWDEVESAVMAGITVPMRQQPTTAATTTDSGAELD